MNLASLCLMLYNMKRFIYCYVIWIEKIFCLLEYFIKNIIADLGKLEQTKSIRVLRRVHWAQGPSVAFVWKSVNYLSPELS